MPVTFVPRSANRTSPGSRLLLPAEIPNWINGEERLARARESFEKLDPTNGRKLFVGARSRGDDVQEAIRAARSAYADWSRTPPVKRGEMLHAVCAALRQHRQEIAQVVALETGKSPASALGETDGAIQLGLFMAGEGQRLYGRTTTSGVPHKAAMTVRRPLGVAGLIVAANTPIANVAWKAFPALICGNTAVLKAAEDTPATAWLFGKLAREAGLPDGVLNIVQGLGAEAGEPIVASPDVDVVSFTGSTNVGRRIAQMAGARLARVSLELGGKNPLIVCDDADIELALRWTLLSAFSNAGQRCAAAGRVIVFESIYDEFVKKLLERTAALRVGPSDDDDFGPVINARALERILAAIAAGVSRGARVLCGGRRLETPERRDGYYLQPTWIEGVSPDDELSRTELFGPVGCLYRARDFEHALALANDSPYGLTAAIHTRSVHRAWQFVEQAQTGVAVVNAGTYGSEPHMPFGGVKQSGNGSREPGTEALDVYSSLQDVYFTVDPRQL